MAQCRLYKDELDEENFFLPRMCLCCGAPAVLTKPKTFAWHPQWDDILMILGLVFCTPLFLAGIICAFATTKRMRVPAPLCQKHMNHWAWRAWYIYGGIGVFGLIGFSGLAY